MKYKILVVISVIASPLYGQRCDMGNNSSKHELSIVIDDIFAKNAFAYLPNIYYSAASYYYIEYPSLELNTPKIGLGYKFHFAKSAIRSKISFGLRNSLSDRINEVNINDNSFLSSGIQLGYELHNNIKSIQIFYGADLFAHYDLLSSEYTYINNSQTYTTERSYYNLGFGIGPLIGVKYFLTSSFSISTELKFSIESYKGENGYNSSGSSEKDITELSGIETKFGPLGHISLNIHF